jgi:GNAT superfamily N-acetyltransferase
MPDPHALAHPRRAGPDSDWDAVLALLRRAFAGMEGRIDPPSSLGRLTAEGIAAQARDGEVWLTGVPPLACLFLTPRADALHLGKLGVDPVAQRRGLARALVAVAQQRARALGLPALELQTRIELVENHAAFRALGFTETGRSAHPGYDRPTTLTFRKPA